MDEEGCRGRASMSGWLNDGWVDRRTTRSLRARALPNRLTDLGAAYVPSGRRRWAAEPANGSTARRLR
jgi:hypothetical protein